MDLRPTTDIGSAGGDAAKRLCRGNARMLGALATPTIEHLARQPSGPDRPPARLWAAPRLLYAAVGGAWVLARRGDPRAAIGTATSGSANSAAALLAHAMPRWGPFSLPYGQGDAGALSWALLSGVAVAGLEVGVAGAQARRGFGAPRRGQDAGQGAEEARAYA